MEDDSPETGLSVWRFPNHIAAARIARRSNAGRILFTASAFLRCQEAVINAFHARFDAVRVPVPSGAGPLARYVREQGVLTLEQAIRRMTSLPADTFGWRDRRRIAPGAAADLVVFDPATVSDRASYADPHHYAEGFSEVIVDSVAVLHEGGLIGEKPGGPLLRGR